jgi:hypothetical protein
LKGKLAVLAVLVAGWGGVTSEAEAAPIRECGDAGSFFGGAVRIYNVTSRVVLCPRARRFARRYFRHGGPACREDRYCTYRGWRCRNVASREETDSRCTNTGGRVVRFQVGQADARFL